MACAQWTMVLRFCFVLGMSGVFAPAWAEEALPELDIVVTAKLTPAMPQEVNDMIARSLRSDMRGIFSRMVSQNAQPGAELPQDGAAKFRLFLDYAAAINCGTQYSMKVQRISDAGGNFTIRRWYLTFDQKASYVVRLAKWTGTKYEDVTKFAGVIPKTEREIREGGTILIAETSTRVGMDQKDPDVCPTPLDEGRKTALQKSMPPSLRIGVFSKLVPVTLAKSTPTKMDSAKPSEMAVELKVENKSPWPLKCAEYAFSLGGAEFVVGEDRSSMGRQAFNLPTPLGPGQATVVKTVAKALMGGTQQGTQNADFVTTTP